MDTIYHAAIECSMEIARDRKEKLKQPATLKSKSTVYHLLCSQMNPVDKAQILARCMDFSKFESNWGKMEHIFIIYL